MKKVLSLVLTIIAAAIIASCTTTQTEEHTATHQIEEPTPSVMVSITSDATVNPHNSLMGMHLAQKALRNGMEATIFLNVSGVKLLAPGAEEINFHHENLQEVLKTFMKDGGTVVACPHCMEVHHLTKENLLEGMVYGKDEVVIDKIKEQPTVFTY